MILFHIGKDLPTVSNPLYSHGRDTSARAKIAIHFGCQCGMGKISPYMLDPPSQFTDYGRIVMNQDLFR